VRCYVSLSHQINPSEYQAALDLDAEHPVHRNKFLMNICRANVKGKFAEAAIQACTQVIDRQVRPCACVCLLASDREEQAVFCHVDVDFSCLLALLSHTHAYTFLKTCRVT
jgi:hypothetical protein